MKKFIRGILNILLFPFKIIIALALINLEVEKFNCKKLDKIIKEVLYKWKNFYVGY